MFGFLGNELFTQCPKSYYRIARNFLGIKSSLFSWILCKPRKFYPRIIYPQNLFMCEGECAECGNAVGLQWFCGNPEDAPTAD